MRFCGECRQSVYNVAMFTRAEATRLLNDSSGRVCLRIFRRPDNTVLTDDCRARLRAARKRGLLIFAGTLLVVFWAQICAQFVGLMGLRRVMSSGGTHGRAAHDADGRRPAAHAGAAAAHRANRQAAPPAGDEGRSASPGARGRYRAAAPGDDGQAQLQGQDRHQEGQGRTRPDDRRRARRARLVEIPIPCEVPWDGMPGDEQVRHCGQCKQNVYNVAAFTRAEAMQLLQIAAPACASTAAPTTP